MRSDEEAMARTLAAAAINHLRSALRRTGVDLGPVSDATLMLRWLARIEEAVDSGTAPISPEVKTSLGGE